jgi:hypothetical protein
VRDLVHAHSGSVQLVDTAPGAVAEAGAHFRIELPRA